MLTKSDLQDLLQCPRKLWLTHHKPELLPEDESGLSRRAMDGLIVNQKAREQLGVPYAWPRTGDDDPIAVAARVKKELAAAPTLAAVEVPLMHAGLYARADALLPRASGYVLRETKASTFRLKKDKQTPETPKDHYLDDVAIQKWVMEGSGLGAAAVELNLLDSAWRYPGNNDYSGLFRQLDVTAEADSRKAKVADWLRKAADVLKVEMPTVATGRHCNHPYDCAFQNFCRKLDPPGPAHPIELLPGIAGKALARKLRETKGYTSILEPTEEELAGKYEALFRRIQKAHKTGKPVFEPRAAALINALGYPRYFFDFEGIDFPVPQWQGFRPYEHAPFQWSCHIERSPGEFEHAEFLDLSGNDPSLACVEEMRRVINAYDAGPLIVYNANYERLRLDDLAIRHPLHGELMQTFIGRLVDLLPIVQDHFYHPAMKGSFSIKSVLPVIAPDLDYGKLDEVQEGTAAQVAYLLATKEPRTTPERRRDLDRKLRTYCRQDTWAMVEVAYFLAGVSRPRRPDQIVHRQRAKG
jgi:hypothetical protein